MPRGPRIDGPGCVQHVMVRGIERRRIFLSDADRRDYLERLASVLPESGTLCFGWALMPNHVHMVLQTGSVRLAKVMARVGTGYAGRFNRRYDRVGHLFQNRYRSRLVHDDRDLIGLVRYVHLNPLAGGLVRDLDELADYPWTGHAALAGRAKPEPFHSVSLVLSLLGGSREDARRHLAELMVRPEAPPPSFDALVERVCVQLGVAPRELLAGSRERSICRAREWIAAGAVVGLGLSRTEVARRLGVSRTAVGRSVGRLGWPAAD